MRRGRAVGPLCAALIAAALLGSTRPVAAAASATTANVVIDAVDSRGILETELGTQLVWPGFLDGYPNVNPLTRAYLDGLGETAIRILAGTDGLSWMWPSPVLPSGGRLTPPSVAADWDFSALDRLVTDVRSAGAAPLLGIEFAPRWMWSCAPDGASINDPTFAEFGDYMARLVAYYNVGSFTEGATIVANPVGTANRVALWELWNEPDQPLAACWTLASPVPFDNLSPSEYVTMWNAVVPKMLAVDPAIKILGPATSTSITGRVPDYIPALMSGATRPPDAISLHGYGGWHNTHSDRFLFDGLGSANYGSCCGLAGMLTGIHQIRAWAPDVPIWLTEISVTSSDVADPGRRPWTGYGAAWGASAFLQLAAIGVKRVFQYQFAHPNGRNLSLVDPYVSSFEVLLPYWRDQLLTRSFVPGSTLVAASSDVAGVEVMAARPPGSSAIRVLVVNRQVASDSDVAAPGVPATVNVEVRNATPTFVTRLVLDNTVTGEPVRELLSPARTATVNFEGYGAAILEFGPTIDPTPPAIDAIVDPPADAFGWHTSDATVRWITSDSESGIAQRSGCETAAIREETRGSTLTCAVTNGVGLRAERSVIVRLDRTVPRTLAIASPSANADGWHRGEAIVALAATDALAGVGRTLYDLDGGGWSVYAAPVVISAEGDHTLLYRSEDLAGNLEAVQSFAVRIDVRPPEVAIGFDPASDGLRVVGRDQGSGVAAGEIVGTSVPPDNAWEERRTYRVFDRAGNAAELVVDVRTLRDALRAALVSVRYNDALAIDLPSNHLAFAWTRSSSGALAELDQSLDLRSGIQREATDAEFTSARNETVVDVKAGLSRLQVVRPGLVLVNLVTDKGRLATEF